MTRYRTGHMYREITNAGRVYRRGVGQVNKWKARFVAQITVGGKRYRFRSTSQRNCENWLADMLEKYPTY